MTGPRRRLRYAASAERQIAVFRLASALVVLPAALAALVLARPLAAKVLAVLGLLVSLGWVAAFLRARARLRDAHAYHLDIDDEGLTIAVGGTEARVPWKDVVEVEVDEERLVVVVRLAGGAAVDVAPVWEDLGLDALRALIEGTWDGAPRPRHS